MPATKLLKNAYNSGELSPYMDGRTDLNKYYNGASKVINALILPHGGFTKRPGTIYKATSASRANLIPFEFSVDDALVLEWTNVLLRFYKDQAIVNMGVGTETIPTGNIIAHWLLNDPDGTTVVDDNGATHNGTASTSIGNITTTGKVNDCFDLDGQYDVRIADADNYTKLMLHFNGTDGDVSTDDASYSEHTINFDGTAQLDTAQKKFGTTSLLFDGDSDSLNIADSTDWDLCGSATDDWTIDFWVKHTDHDGTEIYIAQVEDIDNYWILYHDHGNGLKFQMKSATVMVIDSGFGSEITDTNWHHIALTKDANVYKLYLDGTQEATTTDNDTDTFAGSLYIGQNGLAGNWFDGWMDEIRISKGIVRWPSAFTPPTAAYHFFSFSDDSDDSAFSLVCWANVTDQGGFQVLLSKWRDANTIREWRLSLSNDRKLQLHLADSSANLEGDRVAQWKLDENAANKTILDDTANNHDGLTQTSNTADLTETGKVGESLNLTKVGNDAVVITNDHNDLSFGNGAADSAFSIAAWIYVTNTATVQTILSKYDYTTGSEAREWSVGLNTSEKLYFHLRDESSDAYIIKTSDDALSVGWHFVVCTYDATESGAGMKLYDNNSLLDASVNSGFVYTAMENTATKVVIGAATTAGGTLGDYFNNKIDNVTLFNKELSVAEISVLWNDGNGIVNTVAVDISAVADTALTTGWHFLVSTYSAPADETAAAAGIILYVDGAKVASTNTEDANYTAMQNDDEEVRIGSQRNSADTANENFWEDKIDEVSIFSDVLTPTEIAGLYSTTPYSIVSPYTTAQAFQIHHTQSADVMYIAHEDVHPKKLSRLDTLDWTIVDVPFTGGPFLTENTTAASYVQFARIGGTAEADYYFPADAVGTLTATGTGNEPFNVNMVDALWLVKHTRDVNNDTDTFAKDTNVVPTLQTYASGAIKIKGSATATFEKIATTEMAQLWRKEGNGAWQTYRSFRGDTAFSWTEDADDVYYAMTRDAATINGTLTAKEVINYGTVKITGYTSATVVTCTVVDPVLTNGSGTSATTAMWAEGAWSTYRGFPRTVGFHEDRLWWASSTNDPDRLWSSRSGLYEDMSFSDLGADDEAITPVIADNEVSQIQWMMSRKVMAIGAANREYSLSAQNPEDPITPLDKKSIPQTGFSSSDIQPVLLNDSIFFLQRQGKKLGAMKFDSLTENFSVDDATLLAYGLLDSAPTNMAVSRSPDSLIWVVRTDGVLPTFTYEPKEEVSGWGRQIFGNSAAVETPTGVVESVAVIHGTAEDEIWVNVKRTINTAEVFYTELFAPRSWGSDIEDAKFVDSCLTTDGGLVSTVTAAHLKGETVSVFADGEVFDDAVANASTGVVTLKKATVATDASVIQVGLPYTMKVRSMRLAVPQSPSGLQTDIKRIVKLRIRYIRSLLGSAGTEYDIKDTEDGTLTEFATDIGALYSTVSKDTPDNSNLVQGGFQRDAYTTIISDDPVPFTVLASIVEVEV